MQLASMKCVLLSIKNVKFFGKNLEEPKFVAAFSVHLSCVTHSPPPSSVMTKFLEPLLLLCK